MLTQTKKLHGCVIIVSDRIISGERTDKAGTIATELLVEAGVKLSKVTIVEEGFEAVHRELGEALARRDRVIVTIGGTGVGPRNRTPEATESYIDTLLPGLMTQILFSGLSNTAQAGLSRGLVGLSARDSSASLIINAPSSAGGVRDALSVVCPLLGAIFERL
ncbi:MogA/MoaB family molybdenum cofactor biosynthesis protein [Corynebacterium crudilactis]|uniref:Molybdenum cofactor biosynthesis protein n=1 Tax=Corynebacterium crudilactis TaxID=1652495 RepID=A0A172QSZ1_9CORY|nr:MogA/MoaB family molybdenum cofactor biosynthesis protein [Corynebacterium crudilactis]ANE03761.1 molybdenum cofactor biosynthesis protein [Corynebacterium crudilactis]